MSTEKEVELLSAFRERGQENGIVVNVALTYLKGRPITRATLTREGALRLAGQIISLVEQDFHAGRVQ